jgi:hypothetical protein
MMMVGDEESWFLEARFFAISCFLRLEKMSEIESVQDCRLARAHQKFSINQNSIQGPPK